MDNKRKEVPQEEIIILAAKETDKAVKELMDESDPSDDGIESSQRNS